MRRRVIVLGCILMSLWSATASAGWIQGLVTEIQIRAVGDGNDMIIVWGAFTTRCQNNAFLVLSGDAYFKETMAILIAAKLSGTPIKFDNVYCHSSGNARGNGYVISN